MFSRASFESWLNIHCISSGTVKPRSLHNRASLLRPAKVASRAYLLVSRRMPEKVSAAVGMTIQPRNSIAICHPK
jgi:hypothetical protein